MPIMYKVESQQLPPGVQDLFQLRTTNYKYDTNLFEKPKIGTNAKRFSVTADDLMLSLNIKECYKHGEVDLFLSCLAI